MWFLSLETLENLLSLTASEEVETFEVGNLQNPLPTTCWRSTGVTPYIVGNFGDGLATPSELSIDVDTWQVLYTNAESGDQARLRLATSEANLTASPLYDSGAGGVNIWPGSPASSYIDNFLSNWQYAHQRATLTTQAATWFRIDFDYTGNSDGYVQCGSIGIGKRLTLTADNPYRQGFNRATSRRGGFESSLAAGGLARGGYTGKRDWRGGVYVTKNEWLDDIQPLIDARLNGPVVMVLEESESARPLDYIYFGYVREATPITARANHEITLSIIEP